MATNQSQYVNLGQYNFTTGPDVTGRNLGNMTSTFDTGVFKPSKFELYRLVVGVPSLPSAGQTPMVVQLSGNYGLSLTTCNVTLPAATTVGNLIVVTIATWATGTESVNPAVSAVTLGGSADNFAAVSTETGGLVSTFIWADPKCGQASKNIAITCTGGSGTSPIIEACVYEVSGTLSTTSASTATDTQASNFTSVTVASLVTSSANTTQANDIVFTSAGLYEGANESIALSLTNSTAGLFSGFEVSAGNYVYSTSGYAVLPGSGASVTCTASCTPDNGYLTQSVAAFLPAASSVAPSEIPFTVMIGAKTWDINQTTAGVGTTYDPQNTMFLNQGEQLNVLWTDLPSSVYSTYSSRFTVSAFFRYDPTLPGNTI
jgi:hypothetical protein